MKVKIKKLNKKILKESLILRGEHAFQQIVISEIHLIRVKHEIRWYLAFLWCFAKIFLFMNFVWEFGNIW